MLKYVGSSNAAKDNIVVASNGVSGDLITRIVITETEVQHSGTYKCEPGAAPVASVQVHVLDGELVLFFDLLKKLYISFNSTFWI